ncbi:MAG: hypothetical protein QOE90_2868 [Thermoplasmata archaeon]|jgi:hypothetical protein|nr:hypothetical protein [Thermoplasmata archaeon]
MRALLVAFLLVAPLLAFAVAPARSTPAAPADFLVGFGIRGIDPEGQVNLGGFGFGCCRTSVAHEYPVHVRAVVVGDGLQSVAMASLEVQGSFAAYADGAFGQYDIAKRVETATGGALPRSHVLISSDHSHRGADTTGAWGGVSDAYLQLIADQTAGAILDAYAARAPAHLRVTEINESSYVSSDFNQPNQDTPDGMFRLLFAERPDGALSGVYGTFAAHATLHGSAPLLSPDWPGIVSDKVGARFGGVPVVLGEGAVGRTHPAGDRSTWEDRISNDIVAAYAGSEYVTAPGVSGAEAAITLNAYNPILLGSLAAGRPGCAIQNNPFDSQGINPTCVPIARSNLPPWMAGNQITTLVTALRIGDVLVWGAPGELYPNAQWTVQQHVAASHVVIAGLANDQLGYLIAPSEDWYKIASNPTSDNTLFNVDVTGGDHVACAAIQLARDLGFATVGPDPTICALWALEIRTLPA